ncbi:MAG: type II secretion system F family protein [Bacteroidia bacterium]
MSGINISNLQQKKVPSEKSSAERKDIFAFFNKDISFSGSTLSDKTRERFYSELGILLGAGIDIKTSLDLVVEEQTKKKEREIFADIAESVLNGKSLAEAVKTTGDFSDYEYYSLLIGEQSGRVNEILDELALYYSKKISQKRMVVNALSYPIIVLVTAGGAIFFMMNYIVPMFADVFKRFGGDLPPLTQFIISLSQWLSDYFLIFFLLLVGIIAVAYSSRKKLWFRKAASAYVLKIPFVGNLISKIYLARFCRSMKLLMSAKTPLITSLQLVRKMVSFYPVEHSLTSVEEGVLKGETLSQGLKKFSIYNQRMISLIKVAEEVNQLDVMFEKLSKQYNDEVEYQTSLISSLLEPIMIIFLGALVAFILVAMYLPLFQLSTSFQ